MTDVKQRPDREGVPDRWHGRPQRALRFVRQNGILGTLGLVRTYGIRNSVLFILKNIRFMIAVRANLKFDRDHNIDTAGAIPLEYLTVDSTNKSRGHEYVSTSVRPFKWMMKAISGEDLGSYTFIDVGAGKGRTLLLASGYPFKRIVGVEFARELVEIARRNFGTYRAPQQICSKVEIVQCDATRYDFPDGDIITYFFDPFAQEIFRSVFARLVEDLRAEPRRCIFMYCTPVPKNFLWLKPLLAETGMFQEVPTRPMPMFFDALYTFHYLIYKYDPSAQR